MSKPLTNATTTPLPFEQRLTLVQAEIKARVAAFPKEQQNGIRARLWVNWIRANLLTEKPVTPKPLPKIKADLYPWREVQP